MAPETPSTTETQGHYFGVSDEDLALMVKNSRGQDWLSRSERIGFNFTGQSPIPPNQALLSKLVSTEEVMRAPVSGCGPKFFVVEEQRKERTGGEPVPCATVGQLYINDSTEHGHLETSELYFTRNVGGGSRMIIGNQYVELAPGSIVLLPPRVKHGGCGALDAVMLFSPGLAKRGQWHARDEWLTGKRAKESIAAGLPQRRIYQDPSDPTVDVTVSGAVVAQIPPQFLGDPSVRPAPDETPFTRRIRGITLAAHTIRGDARSYVHDHHDVTKIYLILGGAGFVLLGNKVERVEKDQVIVVPSGMHNALFTEEGGAVNALVAHLSEARNARKPWIERVMYEETRPNVRQLLSSVT